MAQSTHHLAKKCEMLKKQTNIKQVYEKMQYTFCGQRITFLADQLLIDARSTEQ